MAYTAAHTGYIPFDTDAPQIFSLQQTDNYLAGEYLVFLNTITSALSQFLLSPAASFVNSQSSKNIAPADPSAFARHFCYTITLLLWIKRYEVCTPDLLVVTFEIIRSRGSGRLFKVFNLSGYALTSILKASMAAAATDIHHKSLFHPFAADVCHT
jgi:hypothetical protein